MCVTVSFFGAMDEVDYNGDIPWMRVANCGSLPLFEEGILTYRA